MTCDATSTCGENKDTTQHIPINIKAEDEIKLTGDITQEDRSIYQISYTIILSYKE